MFSLNEVERKKWILNLILVVFEKKEFLTIPLGAYNRIHNNFHTDNVFSIG